MEFGERVRKLVWLCVFPVSLDFNSECTKDLTLCDFASVLINSSHQRAKWCGD